MDMDAGTQSKADIQTTRKLLYRGVCKVMDAQNQGRILAKGSTSQVRVKHDGIIKYDGKFAYGPSTVNTARAQQINGSPYDPSAVSTSTSEDVAKRFATTGNTEDGFVYVIDASKLATVGILPLEFPDPEHPHENEVTLVLSLQDSIPPDLIIRKYEVKSDWL